MAGCGLRNLKDTDITGVLMPNGVRVLFFSVKQEMFMSYARIIDKKSLLSSLFIPALLVLTACGGGGDESPAVIDDDQNNNNDPNNSAPTVTISSPDNVTVNDGESITLTGSASDSEDGNLDANIQWSSDKDGTIGQGASIIVTLSTGEHQITASITDEGNATDESSIDLRVNYNPTADAGEEQAIVENKAVTLQATAQDQDGSIASYRWEQIAGDTVQLANPNAQSASFTAPTLSQGSTTEAYSFRLTVTDNDGAEVTDTTLITVISEAQLADCDLTISPGDSFVQAFSQIGAGDTLCLNSGKYQQLMDIPSNTHVKAVVDGGVEIDGGSSIGEDWSGGLVQMRGNNSSVRGLRVHHASINADACHIGGTNNTMRVMSCSHGGSHKHKIPLKVGGSGHLIEDSWAFGEGRYVVQCFVGENITFRRNVARWDSTAPNMDSEPNAAFSIYNCSNVTIENNISLDYGIPETAMRFGGDFYSPQNASVYPTGNQNNHWLGNIAINHSQGTENRRALRFDAGTPTYDNVVKDFYVRGNGYVFVANSNMIGIQIDSCQAEQVENIGWVPGNDNINCSNQADISKRYVDREKTADDLFPWLNEELIKRDLCASGERQSEWCTTSKTLTDYVLNN